MIVLVTRSGGGVAETLVVDLVWFCCVWEILEKDRKQKREVSDRRQMKFFKYCDFAILRVTDAKQAHQHTYYTINATEIQFAHPRVDDYSVKLIVKFYLTVVILILKM
jgi:hypothetical protein